MPGIPHLLVVVARAPPRRAWCGYWCAALLGPRDLRLDVDAELRDRRTALRRSLAVRADGAASSPFCEPIEKIAYTTRCDSRSLIVAWWTPEQHPRARASVLVAREAGQHGRQQRSWGRQHLRHACWAWALRLHALQPPRERARGRSPMARRAADPQAVFILVGVLFAGFKSSSLRTSVVRACVRVGASCLLISGGAYVAFAYIYQAPSRPRLGRTGLLLGLDAASVASGRGTARGGCCPPGGARRGRPSVVAHNCHFTSLAPHRTRAHWATLSRHTHARHAKHATYLIYCIAGQQFASVPISE